jgi:membrane protein YqaA with SNARE-associated domain
MESLAGTVGIYAATLIVGVVSGLVPVVNGELYLISAVIITYDPTTGIVLAVLLAIGQMIAKVVLYQAARRAGDAGHGRFHAKIERARAKVAQWRDKPLALTFVSSIVGLPPFYLVTLVAGIVKVRFVTFLWLGLVGRTIRFLAIALVVCYA